jgi:bifunctional DNase/RNase
VKCQRCSGTATLHITFCEHFTSKSELHLCEKCYENFDRSQIQRTAPKGTDASRADELTQLEIVRVVINELHDQQVLVFRELEGDRSFPFVLGYFEASTIERTLKQLRMPRPLTHDAWLSTIGALGASIEYVFIHTLAEGTYYGIVHFARGNESVDVDVRPSDAVNLAVKAGVPIYIREGLLAQVASSRSG